MPTDHRSARRTSSLGQWCSPTVLALALGIQAWAVEPPVTVELQATRQLAFESDPSNYGEVLITRSAAIGSIAVRINVRGTADRPGTPGADYTLAVNPTDAAKGTLDTTVLGTSGYVTLTLNAGASDVRLRVVAVADADSVPPELGESARLSLALTGPNGEAVIGGKQVGDVMIVDGNVRSVASVVRPVARETVPDTINNLAQNRAFGRAELWFPAERSWNASASSPAYAPYSSRFIETTVVSSTANVDTDAVITARLGSTAEVVDRVSAISEPQVVLLFDAFRSQTEYLGIAGVTRQPIYNDDNSGVAIATATPSNSILVDPTSLPSGAIFTDLTVAGSTITGTATGVSLTTVTQGSAIGKTRLTVIGATLSFPIAEGAEVIIKYNTITAGISTAGTVTTKVSNPILYPKGATSITYETTSGSTPVIPALGDVFILNGQTLRVTNVSGSSVFFWPSLDRDLKRSDNLKLTTHFQAKFLTNKSEVFYIPELPDFTTLTGFDLLNISFFPSPFPFPTGAAANTHDDIPDGDGVKLLISPTDDLVVEGRENLRISLNSTNAQNGYDSLNPQVADIAIADNDVTVSVTRATNAVNPVSSGRVAVNGVATVNLSKTFGANITVPFTILNDREGSTDAIFGTDYTIANASRDANNRVTGFVAVTGGADVATISIVPLAGSSLTDGQSKTVRIALDDSLDYILGGSISGQNNASAATCTLTKTDANTEALPPTDPGVTTAGGTTAGGTTSTGTTAGTTTGTTAGTTAGTTTGTTTSAGTTGTGTGAPPTTNGGDGGSTCGSGSGIAALLASLAMALSWRFRRQR